MATEREARILARLCSGERVPWSALPKKLLGELLEEGLLDTRANGSRRTVSAVRKESLRSYLESRSDALRILLANTAERSAAPSDSRTKQAAATGNSKALGVARSCPGFAVNSFEPIPCRLLGRDVTLSPPEGSFAFVTDWREFSIPEEACVVGIENMENFRLIRRERPLFSSALPRVPLLFVSRFPQSTDLREWLMGIPNRYVHFGDFDLAGISIFLTEFRKHLGARASFLIPEDIGERLARGSRERYDSQYARFRDLESDDPALARLIRLIHEKRRAYDQEGYIEA